MKIISYYYVEARSTNDVRLIKNRTNRLIAIAISNVFYIIASWMIYNWLINICFIYLYTVNFVNYFLVIFMTLLKKPATPSAHVHHYILSTILVNLLIIYTMYYIFMKLRHGELSTAHCLPLVYLLVSIMFALSGLWFYTNKRNNWQVNRSHVACKQLVYYSRHYILHRLRLQSLECWTQNASLLACMIIMTFGTFYQPSVSFSTSW